MLETLQSFLPEIVTGIVGLGAWLNERTKRKKEVEQMATQNIQSVVDLYQEALNDLKKRYDADILELDQKYATRFSELELELKTLKDNVNLWKGKYRKLKEEFDQYKQKHS